MEKKTIGRFISTLRKANGMTQKELGEKLFVSDKTVSRWECDECAPDLSLIPSIAEIFGITTDELLRGERNNPDREVIAEDVSGKQRAKSDKQFSLMLYSRKKKYTNLSFISIGLCLAGVIASAICNLAFMRGLLGFCIACIFLLGATICQICFTISFRLPTDDEQEYSQRIKAANTSMVFSSVKIFFWILLTFAFCLPIAVIVPDSFYGLSLGSWVGYGLLFICGAFLVGYCLYKIIVQKILVDKGIALLDEKEAARVTSERNLLKKIAVVFLIVLALILLMTYILTSFIDENTFTKRLRFDNPDEFIEYMQNEYDEWYREGYGSEPPADIPVYGPNKEWGKIDGKEYYYNRMLYESVTSVRHENGEWEIVVVTDEASQNGEVMYSAFFMSLLSLHAVNLIGCILWYVIKSKKNNKT